MRKKEDIIIKSIVINPVLYIAAQKILDEFTQIHLVKRRREFDNNYWSLINILQFVLYKKKPTKYNIVEKYSKYGDDIKLNNLHTISGFRKEVFLQLMNFFEEKNLVIPIRNEKGNKNYTSGSDNYQSRSTIYYIPLNLVLQMQKYEQEHGEAGECIDIEVSKNNIFYNEDAKKEKQKEKIKQLKEKNKPVKIINGVKIYHDELLPWIEEEMNSPYKDFKKYPSDWQRIDIIRISDIEYDEQKFLQIAKENQIENPVQYLERCKSSAMKTKLSHGRVTRFGWNHLKKCLREAVIYHGQNVDCGADYHNADFRMLVILAWMKKDLYHLNKYQIDQFEADVKAGIYKLMNKWTEQKYGEDRIKELILTFKNATNDSKRWFTQFNSSDIVAMRQIKQKLLELYPTITNMLLNYREIRTDEGVKNCLSVHCQNIEGYLMHQYVLPALEDIFVDPFTMCDAVWIRKSLATKENKKLIESIFEDQFNNLIEAVKNNNIKLQNVA